jgi:hypothetical protein
MAKIYRDVEQGSGDWYRLRMGKPTASNFHKIMSPIEMKPSKSAKDYMFRLIAERLLTESMDDPLNVEWAVRGRELEPAAAAQFEFLNQIELEAVGFITNDKGSVGCSPDRLIKGKAEALEIKCPAHWKQIRYLIEGIETEYKVQVMGQMLIGEFEKIHLYSYSDRMPALHIVTQPDLAYMKHLGRLVSDFCEQLDYYTEKARALGAYAVNVNFSTPLDETVPGADPLQIVIPD